MFLQDKVAVVTGGGCNIGQAISRELAGHGARVVIADIMEDASRETLQELINTDGEGHSYCKTDMTDEAGIAALRDFVLGKYGRVDLLINNAGIAGPHANVEDIALADWRLCNAVNLDGVFLACKHFVPAMKKQGAGAIVNVSSVSAKRPLVGRAPYCASKMGVIGLTRCLAAELGAYGIRVNAVCPGSVDSPRQEMIVRRYAEQAGITYEEAARAKTEASPLKTLVPQSSVAEVIAFLCSEAASMMTGQDINVSAGVVMY